MTVGALLQLGLPLATLRDLVRSLDLHDVEVAAERVSRNGIEATKLHVHVGGVHAEHAGAGHHHPHRPYREIRRLLERDALPARVRATALAIFARLAEAEG